MAKQNELRNLSRRNVIAAVAAVAPASTLAFTRQGSGAETVGADLNKETAMFDDLGTQLVSNDTQLKTLFDQWEPLAQSYTHACDEEDAADRAYSAAVYHAPKRYHEALKAIQLRQAVQQIWDEAYEKDEFAVLKTGKFPFKRLTDEQRREMIEENIATYLEPGETHDGFLKQCNEELQKEIRSKTEAKARYRIEELRARINEICAGERKIAERMAKIPADTMRGVGLKLTVAQSISVNALAVSLMADIRRFANLPPAPDGVEDPFIHAFG